MYICIDGAWLMYKTKLRDTNAIISRPCLPTDPRLASIHRSPLFQRTDIVFHAFVGLPLARRRLEIKNRP